MHGARQQVTKSVCASLKIQVESTVRGGLCGVLAEGGVWLHLVRHAVAKYWPTNRRMNQSIVTQIVGTFAAILSHLRARLVSPKRVTRRPH